MQTFIVQGWFGHLSDMLANIGGVWINFEKLGIKANGGMQV